MAGDAIILCIDCEGWQGLHDDNPSELGFAVLDTRKLQGLTMNEWRNKLKLSTFHFRIKETMNVRPQNSYSRKWPPKHKGHVHATTAYVKASGRQLRFEIFAEELAKILQHQNPSAPTSCYGRESQLLTRLRALSSELQHVYEAPTSTVMHTDKFQYGKTQILPEKERSRLLDTFFRIPGDVSLPSGYTLTVGIDLTGVSRGLQRRGKR